MDERTDIVDVNDGAYRSALTTTSARPSPSTDSSVERVRA
jgi:hypothetical protein